MLDTSLTSAQAGRVANARSGLASQVPFLEKDELESRATKTLTEIGYVEGEVSLDAVCAREKDRCKLDVLTGVESPDTDSPNPVLGRIIFDPLEIQVYVQAERNRGRERFTLAHELAHHLLQHAQYLSRESCYEEDFALHGRGASDSTDIARMEFQANFFAASLLMPRTNVIEDFRRLVRGLDIPNKGFGALYVDNQPCNLKSYIFVSGQLSRKYGVSQTATTIRLEGLDLLQDARTPVDHFL